MNNIKHRYRIIGIFILTAVFSFITVSLQGDTSGTEKYFQVDIGKHVNMEFEDKVEGDQTGGWSDRGKNDMRGFPVGPGKFGNIPFNVIDPKKNGGKSLIILKAGKRLYFPETAEGIKIGKNVSKLYFLNASDTNSPKGTKVAKYVIHYADGYEQEIPVRFGIDIGNNWLNCNAVDMPNAKCVWTGNNPQAQIGAFLSSWINPYPGTAVKSIDFISTVSATSPALIALTAELAGEGGAKTPGANGGAVFYKRMKELEAMVKKMSEKIAALESRISEQQETIRTLNQDITTLWNKESANEK